MLTRLVVSASLAVFVATQAPAMLASGKEFNAPALQPVSISVLSQDPNQATLTVGRDGHFVGRFLVNGRPVTGIIDTGATFVAFNEAVARDIGIRPDDLTYNYTVATAAGDVKAARVTLASLMLDSVSLTDVDALVVRNNDALPATLIGMSFLGRLSSYAVAGDTMRLAR